MADRYGPRLVLTAGAALNALKSETIYMDDETGYNDYPLLGEAAE